MAISQHLGDIGLRYWLHTPGGHGAGLPGMIFRRRALALLISSTVWQDAEHLGTRSQPSERQWHQSWR